MSRFKLEKSEQPGWWVLTDTENLIVCKFKEHEFNETQQLSTLYEEDILKSDLKSAANRLAHIAAEMGDYMFSHWYSVAMPTPVHEFRQDDENDRMLLIRNKFPRFTLAIQGGCDLKQLSDAMKAGAEFVKQYNEIYNKEAGSGK